MTMQRAVTVLLEDRLITFNRAVGLIRRRNLPVRSIAVGPTVTPGVSRLTIMIQSDEATAERAVQQLRRSWASAQATAFPARTASPASWRWSRCAPPRDRYGELLDVVQLYHASVVDDDPEATIIELTGSEAFVLSCIRALERFDILEVARSGAVALETGLTEAGTSGCRRTSNERRSNDERSHARVLRCRCRPRPPRRPHLRDHRLRQPGSRPCPEPPRQRRQGHRGPPEGRRLVGQGQGGRPRRPTGRRRGGGRRCDHDAHPRSGRSRDLRGRGRPGPHPGQDPDVRPWVQHPFRRDRAARGRGRVHGRAQVAGTPGAE